MVDFPNATFGKITPILGWFGLSPTVGQSEITGFDLAAIDNRIG